jgi:uncharacterized membrane protein
MVLKSPSWKEWIGTLVAFVVLDTMYLSHTVHTIYKPGFGMVGKPSLTTMDTVLGALTWVLLTIGTVIFVLPSSFTPLEAFSKGALLGFIIYGVYNFTNKATLKTWDTKMMVTDIAWGTFLSGLVSWLVFSVLHARKPKVSWKESKPKFKKGRRSNKYKY